MNRIAENIGKLASPLAGEMGCEIWDVEYLKEAGQWFLRIYIDKPEGVSIDDCERFSRAFEPILDEADPIETGYIFEVSSAGAERELKRPSDFERFMGKNVEVRLYQNTAGGKSFTGPLVSYHGGDVTIITGGEETAFKKTQIAQVRLRIV